MMSDTLSTMRERPSPIENLDDVEECRSFDDEDDEPQTLLKLSSFHHPGYITFRPLQASDRDQIQQLHEDWFPVTYKEEFYDHVVLERMVHSGDKLFTRAAVYHEPPSTNESEDEDECIAACIVGSLLEVSRIDQETASLLIPDTSQHSRVFYIMTLGTVTEFRHFRLATMLVEKCMELVEKDSKCGALYLHVITFNTAAIRFYERLGFHRVKEIEDYYRIDGKLHNCYIYARYFHGNRGHWDFYYLVTQVVSSVWQRLTRPFSVMTTSQS